MRNNATYERYPCKMRFLHHLSAILIITLLAVGLYMSDLDKSDPNKSFLYTTHKTVGWFFLWILLFRFWVRKSENVHFNPPAPMATLAQIGHRIMYLVMLIMPISGWLMSSAFGKNVVLFGIEALTIPNLIGVNPELGETLEGVHEYTAYILIAMIIGHLLFALYHTFVQKHNVIKRMIP